MEHNLGFKSFRVKSSGSIIRAQIWLKNGVERLWDGINWYDMGAVEVDNDNLHTEG